MSGSTAAPHSGEHGSTASEIVIYHYSACGTSRRVLALIRDAAGAQPRVVQYLKPIRDEFADLIRRMEIRVRDLLRRRRRRTATSGSMTRRSAATNSPTPCWSNRS